MGGLATLTETDWLNPMSTIVVGLQQAEWSLYDVRPRSSFCTVRNNGLNVAMNDREINVRLNKLHTYLIGRPEHTRDVPKVMSNNFL